jgi:hypothetical protein
LGTGILGFSVFVQGFCENGGPRRALPSLAANADALGFETRATAARLIKAAEKCSVNATFEPSEALRIRDCAPREIARNA